LGRHSGISGLLHPAFAGLLVPAVPGCFADLPPTNWTAGSWKILV
jgi:hypothetical protein